MVKLANGPKASGGGCSSKSAFKRALHVVRSRKMYERTPDGQSGGTRSRKKSSVKRKKAFKDKINSRCAPSIVVDVIEDLDGHLMALVKEVGFQGLGRLKITRVNRQFGAWILSKMDPTSGNLFAGTKSELSMTCEDVNRVIDIPYSGKPIIPATPHDVQSHKEYLCSLFGQASWDEITMKFLLKIISKKYEHPMTRDEILQFKTAFVIFVVTKFLAPQSLNNFISTRYIKALVDIENNHMYNWANFVLEELRSAAGTLQYKLGRKKSPGYVNGCILLPEIYYIDNLDFGKDCPPHDSLPRIGAYDDQIVAKFIEKDIVLRDRTPFPTYGKNKFRHANNVCYDHGKNINRSVISLISPHTQSVRDALLNMPAPSFDLGFTQTEPEETAGVCSPHSRVGNNLAAEFELAANEEIVQDTPDRQQQPAGIVFQSPTPTFMSPHTALKETSGARIVFREEDEAVKHNQKAKRRIIGDPSDLLVENPKRVPKPSRMVKSPFITKHVPMRHDIKALEDLYIYTTSITDEDSLRKIWLHISEPSLMSLRVRDIQQAISFDHEMEDEVFNLAIQVLLKDEILRFSGTDFLGWRHFLSQDFAMYAAAGGESWNPTDHVHLFKDDTIPYDVSSSQMIFVPLHQPYHYSLYAYDMAERKLSILDPYRDINKDGHDIEARHAKTKNHISEALQQCMKLCFPDWDEDITEWHHEFPLSIPVHQIRYDCAFQVLFYMRNWDGNRLVNQVTENSREVRKEFLAFMLALKENEVLLPDHVTRCLKELFSRK